MQGDAAPVMLRPARRLTLRAQLFLAMGILSALPVIVLGAGHTLAWARSESARADRETLLASSSLARELGRMLQAREETVRALGREAGTIDELNEATVRRMTARSFGVHSGFYVLLVADPTGIAIGGSPARRADGKPLAGTSYGDRDYLRRILLGAPFASELVGSRTTGQPAVIFAVPVTSRQGTTRGIAIAGIDLDPVDDAVARVTAAAPGLETIVLDRTGRVIASAGQHRRTPLMDLSHLALYRAPTTARPERRRAPDELEEARRGTAVRVVSGDLDWHVVATWPESAVAERAWQAVVSTVVLALAALGLALACAAAVARLIARPVSELSTVISAIGRGDLRTRPEAPGRWDSREVADLKGAIGDMLTHLETLIVQLGRTTLALADAMRRLRDASQHMSTESAAQKDASQRSTAAVVQMTDSIGGVTATMRDLTLATQETNQAVSSLDRQIAQIAESLGTLALTIDGASTDIREMGIEVDAVATSALDLRRNVENTAGSLGALADASADIRSGAERSQALAHEAIDAAEAGRAAVEHTIGATREIHESFQAVESAVHELAGRSEAIGQVVSVIDQVTRATHLLAINASIIASQAGEHGRGFGVVAEQVKAVAVDTAASTEEITRLVESVQADIRRAVRAVQQGQKTVGAGERRSAEAGKSLHGIIVSSRETEQNVRQIVEAAEEQARRAQVVQIALSDVRRATGRIEVAVAAQRRVQEQMVTAMGQVRSVGEQVRESMENQREDSRAMAAAARAMMGQFTGIARSIEEQNQERGRIQSGLDVFQGASEASLQRARTIEEVVETLSERLAQLERELGAFRVGPGHVGSSRTKPGGADPSDE